MNNLDHLRPLTQYLITRLKQDGLIVVTENEDEREADYWARKEEGDE